MGGGYFARGRTRSPKAPSKEACEGLEVVRLTGTSYAQVMEPTDLTIEILKSIRDEMRGMRADLSERIDRTNERLDTLERTTNARFERLERLQVEVETRLATQLVAVVGVLQEIKGALREGVATTLRDHERRIAALEERAEP